MSDVERLQDWFASGRLLRPDPSLPNTVDLTRALARVCGAPGFDDAGARALAERIGEAECLIFVLVDGLGMSMLENLHPEGFLARHVDLELRSVFPSATACAITTLATGAWPNQHGVTGWWTYLPDRELTITSLPFIERSTRRPLEELGIGTADVFPLPTILSQFARTVCTFQPQRIIDSAYSRYLRGSTDTQGYDDLDHGVDVVAQWAETTEGPSYAYFYISSLDHTSHDHGPDSDEVRSHLHEIDAALERFAARLAGRARIVVSSDHGQITVEEQDKLILGGDDDLLGQLVIPPTCEPRAPYFHVRPGREQAFRDAFAARFGERYALLTAAETEALELLGPGASSPTFRERVGTFVAFPAGHEVLLARKGEERTGTELIRGFHGGLLPDEVRIPLICV